NDARRKVRLLADLREMERGERRRFRRLQDDRVAAGESRRELPSRHEQRKVPGNDLAADADRGDTVPGKGVLELVAPARMVEEVGDGEGDVDIARLFDRLSAVHRLENRELARFLLQESRDSVDVLAALGGGELPPILLVRLLRGCDGRVDVRGAPFGNL